MKPIRISIKLFSAIILFLGMYACSFRSTPPGPDIAAGGYNYAAYDFFRWEQGLNVMIWHDAGSSSACSSSGSTNDPMHSVDCHAVSFEGQRFDWQIKTVDGLTGEFRINNEPYDLSDGSIFIVRTRDGIMDIQQLIDNLSSVSLEHDSIVAFGLDHKNIAQFIQSVSLDVSDE